MLKFRKPKKSEKMSISETRFMAMKLVEKAIGHVLQNHFNFSSGELFSINFDFESPFMEKSTGDTEREEWQFKCTCAFKTMGGGSGYANAHVKLVKIKKGDHREWDRSLNFPKVVLRFSSGDIFAIEKLLEAPHTSREIDIYSQTIIDLAS